jgi:hypothetical protein
MLTIGYIPAQNPMTFGYILGAKPLSTFGYIA